jgi:hypothetical protein
VQNYGGRPLNHINAHDWVPEFEKEHNGMLMVSWIQTYPQRTQILVFHLYGIQMTELHCNDIESFVLHLITFVFLSTMNQIILFTT